MSTLDIWQGRFYSSILDDAHAFEALRFVETNPVRWRLVDDAPAYPWSSARGHALVASDPVLQDGCSIVRGVGRLESLLERRGRRWRRLRRPPSFGTGGRLPSE